MTKPTLTKILSILAATLIAACDNSAKKANDIVHAAVIQGHTATLSFTFDEVSQIKSDTEWLIPGFTKMPSAALMKYSKPIVLAIYNLAQAHPDLSQVIVEITCRRKGYTSEDHYGNRSHTPASTAKEEPIVIDSERLTEIRRYRDADHYLTVETVADFAEELGYKLL